MVEHVVAVIGDIVGSRRLEDRDAAQRAIVATFAEVERHAPSVLPAYESTGDEFQLAVGSLHDAILGTTLFQLLLPDGIDCRFGIGVGWDRLVESSDAPRIRDGSAWWNARAAIDDVHASERHLRSSRTAIRGAPEPQDAMLTSLLVLRDHVVMRMTSRERRITAATLRGSTQQAIASTERVSQSAVSQSLQRSGGASVVAMLRMLAGAST